MSVLTPRDASWSPAARNKVTHDLAPAAEPAIALETQFATPWTRLQAGVATSRGRRHAVNEDCHSDLVRPVPLFVVADGVGGGALASRASRELVSRLHAALDASPPDADKVRGALLEADRAIGQSIATRAEAPGAATVALCKGAGATLSRWLVAWVGDCRVYRVRSSLDMAAELLTVDDTYRQLREEPPRGGSPDDPARMIGNGAVDAPNVRSVELRAGEMLVLCSDGVHKHAAPGDIGRLLRGPAPLARRCTQLIDFARSSGSRDDATVLVVHRVERGLLRWARGVLIAALVAAITGMSAWLALDSSAKSGAAQIDITQIPR
jgi:PPM family protein phosphatase